MQVFIIPIEIMSLSQRLTEKVFIEYIISGNSLFLPRETENFQRKVYYSEDEKFYSIFFVSKKKPKRSCQVDNDGGKEILHAKNYSGNDGEFNLLVLCKESMTKGSIKGAYVYYQGGFSLSKLKDALRKDFSSYLRQEYGRANKEEKLLISNITDNKTLLDKIKQLSEVKRVAMTMKIPKTKVVEGMDAVKRFKDVSETVHIEYRGKYFFSSSVDENDDLFLELERIAKDNNCTSLSLFGPRKGMDIEGTVSMLNASNHIRLDPYEEIVEKIDGCVLEEFTSSKLYKYATEEILSGQHQDLFL